MDTHYLIKGRDWSIEAIHEKAKEARQKEVTLFETPCD